LSVKKREKKKKKKKKRKKERRNDNEKTKEIEKNTSQHLSGPAHIARGIVRRGASADLVGI
jgi:hypothetical protein